MHVILHEWRDFYSTFLNIHQSGVLKHWHGWCHMKLLPSLCILCTPYNHAPCHFMQVHIYIFVCVCKVHACLAVTCHLHFWQNDRDLLRATVVTQVWNGYRNKSVTHSLKGNFLLLTGLPLTVHQPTQAGGEYGPAAPENFLQRTSPKRE